MPHNPHLLNLNVQDVFYDILKQEPKDMQDEVVDRHIRESSHLGLIALGVTISEKNIESMHLIEATTEGVIQDIPRLPEGDAESGKPHPGNLAKKI